MVVVEWKWDDKCEVETMLIVLRWQCDDNVSEGCCDDVSDVNSESARNMYITSRLDGIISQTL